MNHEDVIAAESERFASVLATAHPRAQCPTCPEWNAADLLWHLTGVQHFWANVLSQDVRTDDAAEALGSGAPPQPSAISEMLPVREVATRELVDELRRLGDDEPRWTWWEADQTVGFTRRMQVCEATMHRIDAELTAQLDVHPIAEDVATLCVDHCVDVMWGWMPDWATWTPQAVVELVAEDTGGRWLIEVGPWRGTGPDSGRNFDVPRAVRARPDAPAPTGQVAAPVDQLARWAWTRQGEAEVTGQPEATSAVEMLLAQGIQ